MNLLIGIGLKKIWFNLLIDTDTDIEQLQENLAELQIERNELKMFCTQEDIKRMLPKIEREINSIESDICFIQQNINHYNMAKGEGLLI